MNRFLLDTNVLLDIATADATWLAWSEGQFLQRLPLPYDAGWLAAQAFLKYRRAGGTENSPLPDFYIGGASRSRGADAGDPRHCSLPPPAKPRRGRTRIYRTRMRTAQPGA